MLPKAAGVLCPARAPDLYAPGHIGELTQIIDPSLVDAVIEETAAREQRLRLLPAPRGPSSASSRRSTPC
ncbi:transposase domain-containing protein [Streptomyces sp. T028]|uniref:transposase domain-containing protein n=1 Tax=Streptomyces sp. T028 TaxID=3394379 RepID=UPI003A8ABAB0